MPDDDATLVQAKPITADGQAPSIEPAKLAARHDAQVKAVVKRGSGLVILRGPHDLSDSVRRPGMGQDCTYG